MENVRWLTEEATRKIISGGGARLEIAQFINVPILIVILGGPRPASPKHALERVRVLTFEMTPERYQHENGRPRALCLSRFRYSFIPFVASHYCSSKPCCHPLSLPFHTFVHSLPSNFLSLNTLCVEVELFVLLPHPQPFKPRRRNNSHSPAS